MLCVFCSYPSLCSNLRPLSEDDAKVHSRAYRMMFTQVATHPAIHKKGWCVLVYVYGLEMEKGFLSSCLRFPLLNGTERSRRNGLIDKWCRWCPWDMLFAFSKKLFPHVVFKELRDIVSKYCGKAFLFESLWKNNPSSCQRNKIISVLLDGGFREVCILYFMFYLP